MLHRFTCIQDAGIVIRHSREHFSILQGPERDWREGRQRPTRDLEAMIKSTALAVDLIIASKSLKTDENRNNLGNTHPKHILRGKFDIRARRRLWDQPKSRMSNIGQKCCFLLVGACYHRLSLYLLNEGSPKQTVKQTWQAHQEANSTAMKNLHKTFLHCLGIQICSGGPKPAFLMIFWRLEAVGLVSSC